MICSVFIRQIKERDFTDSHRVYNKNAAKVRQLTQKEKTFRQNYHKSLPKPHRKATLFQKASPFRLNMFFYGFSLADKIFSVILRHISLETERTKHIYYLQILGETMPIDVKNEAQKMMLNLISRVQSEEELQELKLLISNYFADKAQKEIDDLWKQGILSQTKLDAICHQHNRTAYH